jgi:hypothetical protein
MRLGWVFVCVFAAAALWDFHIDSVSGQELLLADVAAANDALRSAYMPAQPDTLPAFPGAYGKAAYALQTARDSAINGSWPFQVFYITSLADTGDGTARAVLTDSVDADAYNVVIPDTFGVVECDGSFAGRTISIKDVPNIYYAGQLGPGSGLDFRNCRIDDRNNNTDRVWRNLRISGSTLWDDDGRDPVDRFTGRYGIWIRGGENHYFDHGTFRWNRYMQWQASGDTQVSCFTCVMDGVTIANSMIYDADSIQGGGQAGQPLGFSAGGESTPGSKQTAAQHYVMYQTFSMNNSWRNPLSRGDSIWLVNNICYNTKRDCGQWNEDFTVDLIGNLSKRGGWNETGDSQSGSYHHVFDGGLSRADTSIYIASLRNIRNGNDWTVPSDSLWRGSKRSIAMYRTVGIFTEGDTVPLRWKRDTPLTQNHFPFPIHTPNDAWLDSTLLHVGASRKVDSLGNWTYVTSTGANIRTFYDSLRIKQFVDSSAVNMGTGQVPDTMNIGIGQGTAKPDSNEVMRPGAPIGDLDRDGLPNAFEKAYQGSSDSTSLQPDSMSASGYLVWELYADGKALDWSPGAPAPQGPTYGDERLVYLVPLDSEQVQLGSGADTMTVWRYVPNRDSVPVKDPPYSYYPMYAVPRDSLLVVTYDTITEIGAGWLDSVEVDAAAADLGITYPPYPYSMTIPGEP